MASKCSKCSTWSHHEHWTLLRTDRQIFAFLELLSEPKRSTLVRKIADSYLCSFRSDEPAFCRQVRWPQSQWSQLVSGGPWSCSGECIRYRSEWWGRAYHPPWQPYSASRPSWRGDWWWGHCHTCQRNLYVWTNQSISLICFAKSRPELQIRSRGLFWQGPVGHLTYLDQLQLSIVVTWPLLTY